MNALASASARLRATIVLVGALAALAVSAPAQATTERQIDSSQSARGVFASFDHQDGCLSIHGDVYAEKGMKKGVPYAFAFVGYNRTDTCTNTVLASGGGELALGSGDLQIARDLSAATLSTNAGGVSLDLAWGATSSGPLQPEAFIDHFNDHDGLNILIHGVQAGRDATASGSFSVDGDDYALGPADVANIVLTPDGIVAVQRV